MSHLCRVQYLAPDSEHNASWVGCSASNTQHLKDLFNCTKAKCQVCLDLAWDQFPHYSCYSESFSRPPNIKEVERQIETSIRAVDASCRSCELCKLIQFTVQMVCERQDDICSYDDLIKFAAKENEKYNVKERAVIIILRAEAPATIIVFLEAMPRIVEVELYTKPGTETSSHRLSIGQARHVASSPSVKYCVDFIKVKLAECRGQHSECQQSTLPKLPTRVIDVGTSDTSVRLLESHGVRGEYVTLSHRWGSIEHGPLRTESLNLATHYSMISWSKLGRTFQDAIIITRRLGIQYLWIDSLCIIQDSKSDWENESSQMADIYMCSVLTLVATSSIDSRGGLLSPRHVPEAKDRILNDAITSECCLISQQEQKSIEIFIRFAANDAHTFMSTTQGGNHVGAPLLTRAWVYQEVVVSPRTIHFHSQELIWECRETIKCECGHFERTLTVTQNAFPPGWKQSYTSPPKARIGYTDEEAIIQSWYKIIAAYSPLVLTYNSDRLPALSGLAAGFAKRLNTRYLAGLWESDLWRGLLWFNSRDDRNRRLVPSEGTIPTWSWASTVSTSRNNSRVGCDAIWPPSFSSELNFLTEQHKVDNRFRVVRIDCEPSSPNAPFGQVSGGTIKLYGAMMAARRLADTFLCSLSTGKHQTHCALDIHDRRGHGEVPHGGTVYCLLVANKEVEEDTGMVLYPSHFLVLKKIQDTTYQRVGLIHWSNVPHILGWFHDPVIAYVELV